MKSKSAFIATLREEQPQPETIWGDVMPERSAFERPGTGLFVGFIGADGWLVHRVKHDVRDLQVVLYGSTRRRQINSFRLFVFHLRSPPFFGSGIADWTVAHETFARARPLRRSGRGRESLTSAPYE